MSTTGQIIEKVIQGEHCTQEELSRCRYCDLEEYIDNQSPENAIHTMNHLFKINLTNMKNNGKIKVAFLVYSSSEWQCEEIYRKMEEDAGFEPVVFICAYRYGKDEQNVYKTYRETCKYFMKAKNPYHIHFGGCQKYASFKNKLDDFDLVFYFNVFESMQPHQNNVKFRKLNQLLVHIPYGIYFVNKKDVCYKIDYYNQILFKCCWIYFAESMLHREEAERSERLRAYNVKVSGFPKVDIVLENRVLVRSSIWKETDKKRIRLIWAPHFNMKQGMNGTFYENYQWFFQYAKEHQEISWIVRPHPRMDSGVLAKGIFQSVEEYQAYLKQWDNLPNARVIPYGDYLDIFVTSDAMILDCMSFLSEYQYTGKPLLFLKPEQQRSMGEYGKHLVSHLYQSRGNDFEKISNFIDMILKKEDPMQEERKEFFDTYLNYISWNGVSASQFIFQTITTALGLDAHRGE